MQGMFSLARKKVIGLLLNVLLIFFPLSIYAAFTWNKVDKSISSEFGGGGGGNKRSEKMPFWSHNGHRVVAMIISARKCCFITIDLFRSYAYSMTKLAILAAYVSLSLLFFVFLIPFQVYFTTGKCKATMTVSCLISECK